MSRLEYKLIDEFSYFKERHLSRYDELLEFVYTDEETKQSSDQRQKKKILERKKIENIIHVIRSNLSSETFYHSFKNEDDVKRYVRDIIINIASTNEMVLLEDEHVRKDYNKQQQNMPTLRSFRDKYFGEINNNLVRILSALEEIDEDKATRELSEFRQRRRCYEYMSDIKQTVKSAYDLRNKVMEIMVTRAEKIDERVLRETSELFSGLYPSKPEIESTNTTNLAEDDDSDISRVVDKHYRNAALDDSVKVGDAVFMMASKYDLARFRVKYKSGTTEIIDPSRVAKKIKDLCDIADSHDKISNENSEKLRKELTNASRIAEQTIRQMPKKYAQDLETLKNLYRKTDDIKSYLIKVQASNKSVNPAYNPTIKL